MYNYELIEKVLEKIQSVPIIKVESKSEANDLMRSASSKEFFWIEDWNYEVDCMSSLLFSRMDMQDN